MMRNKKSSKGITLISMILAVIVLMIIIGTISYSSRSSFQARSLQNLYTDVDGINDAVSVYYMKNKILPIYTSYYDYNGNPQNYGYITLPNTYNSSNNTYFFNFKEDGRDADRDEKNIYFGIIDIDKIKSTNLNEKNNLPDGIGSGNFFKPKTGGEPSDLDNLKQSIKDGIFVMNMTTHKVYYTKGIQSDGKKYFARNVYTKGGTYFAENDLINVPNFYTTDEGQSLDETILSQGEVEVPADAIKVKYFANGGTGAPPETIITQDMITANPNLGSYISTVAPSRTGMKFLGWAFTTGNSSAEVKYVLSAVYGHGSYYSIITTNGEDIRLPNATFTPGSTISLYAVWEVRDDVLLCYYPDDTGGIKPEISPYKVSRTSSIPDGVINYLCVDIPSSGYKLTWNWDNSQNDEKEALYDGTRRIDITDESGYITTEPGTIKLKGSFTNLKVAVEKLGSNESEFQFKINDKDVLNIYNTELSLKRRDKVGSRLGTEWLVGNNRAFTVPENVMSYKIIGIKDPEGSSGSTNYADYLDTTASYFLKKMVVVESGNNISSVLQDYERNSYAVGTVAQLPDDNQNYSIYPYFASRNYRLSSSSPEHTKYYYHDNLQEAYNDSVEKAKDNYDKITVLNTVKYSKVQVDYIYETQFDPACETLVQFNKKGTVVLDCANYYLQRKKNIAIGAFALDGDTDITLTANSGYGLKFEYSSNYDNNIQLTGTGILKVDGNCNIVSNTQGHLIYLQGSSKLVISKAKIENTNTTDSTGAMIYTVSNNTTACIGCEDEDGLNYADSNKDSLITLKNPNGYVWDLDMGNVYWNYGILYTKKIACKAGYTPGTENHITTAGIQREPCIYQSGGDYKVQLETRLWEFVDKDSGTERTYYSNNLYNAHDMYNLANNTLETKTLTFTKNSMNISNDYATITKDVILDYNTDAYNVISSSNGYLIFNHDSTIKNCYMVLSTNQYTNGIVIGNSGSAVLNIENSNIQFDNISSSRYCVYNNNGTFNLISSGKISGGRNGIINTSGNTVNIYGDVTTTQASCVNGGRLNVFTNGYMKSTSGCTLNNTSTGTSYIYSGILVSSGTGTITNSGTVNTNYSTIYSTGGSSITLDNSGTINLNNTTDVYASGSSSTTLWNEGYFKSVSSNVYNTSNSSGATVMVNEGTLNFLGGKATAYNRNRDLLMNLSSTATFNSNPTSMIGNIQINDGEVKFPESSGVNLTGNVTIYGGDLLMGYCDADVRYPPEAPKVRGVTVYSGGWFYFYDGNAGSLSGAGRTTIPTHPDTNCEFVISYSGGAHIVVREYLGDGTYMQEGVRYNSDGSIWEDPEADDSGSGGGSGGGNFDEFGNENL